MKNNKHFALAVGDNEIIDETGKRCYWDADRNNVEKDKAVHETFAAFLQAHRPDFDFLSDAYGTYKTLIRGNYITNGFLFRKECFLAVGKCHPGIQPEDWHVQLKLARRYRIKFINQILLSYRWHPQNTIKHLEYLAFNNVEAFEKKNNYAAYSWHKKVVPFWERPHHENRMILFL
jgi:alpha-1,3-rhamnosyltransferase